MVTNVPITLERNKIRHNNMVHYLYLPEQPQIVEKGCLYCTYLIQYGGKFRSI